MTRDFHHPYQPYDIQLQLMNKIYDTIDKGYKVGIFESPTGTGKTLSLICSTMSWLRNYKKNNIGNEQDGGTDSKDGDGDSDSDSEPEWVNNTYQSTIVSRTKQTLKDYELHLEDVSRDYALKKFKVQQLTTKRLHPSTKPSDEDFLPPDYIEKNDKLKEEINYLLNKIDGNSNFIPDIESPKIFFSSRTHSQLNQFTSQLTLPRFESSIDDILERTKYIPLGSRKQLCIHPKVSNLTNIESINDGCKELVTNSNCEFLHKSKDLVTLGQFNDYSMTRVHDIEEINNLGKFLKICPYYSIRQNIKVSEIISLPYQSLLESDTRNILKLDLKNSIIIIDEAHNLLDTITSMNSVKISYIELSKILNGLNTYFNKFINRLNSGNRINLVKLIKIVKLLIQFFDKQEKKLGQEINANDIFLGNSGDLFNINNLESYLSKLKIAFKIENYLESISESVTGSDDRRVRSEKNSHSRSNPLLYKLVKFLKCLSFPSKEGKFFWDLDTSPSISYLLLDPSEIFKPIIDQCKCLILCGGTMEPMNDYHQYLFPYIDHSQINTFSCNHIIPDENLKVIPISQNNVKFDFTFKNRNNSTLINDLGETLITLFKNIPYGVVVFFPSYKYLTDLVQIWKKTGIYQKFESTKGKVFIESQLTQVDKILDEYSNQIINHKSSILFSVVGGKLSEGINFQDNLARAVIMIGLPYPNLLSTELVAKRKYIESHGGTERSKEFIENICMRSINQSIGRSIRHINDYSMIYLIDERYTSNKIQNKLSGWINKRILPNLSMLEIVQETNDFFTSKSITKLT